MDPQDRDNRLASQSDRTVDRRLFLKCLFGVSGFAALAAVVRSSRTDAARRGFSGPAFVAAATSTTTPAPVPTAEPED